MGFESFNTLMVSWMCLSVDLFENKLARVVSSVYNLDRLLV